MSSIGLLRILLSHTTMYVISVGGCDNLVSVIPVWLLCSIILDATGLTLRPYCSRPLGVLTVALM